MGKAIIHVVLKGDMLGEYYFLLKGNNNQVIATSETYKRKQSITNLLKLYFPDFKVIDKSDIDWDKVLNSI